MPWGARSPGNGNDPPPKRRLGLGRYKTWLPGPPGMPAPGVAALAAVLAVVVGFYAFAFTVAPDELGVVMRFGKVERQEGPGLHFRLPYPIDEVRLPKVTRQNIIEVGMRTGVAAGFGPAGSSAVREEALMLTGDENIVDINFVVYWRIQEPLQYLFNIQKPEATVKDVAESAMREVVGQSNIQPILTGARQQTEEAVQKLMQSVLNAYRAGIRIDQVRLQKIDPPAQVIDAFRDVQAAATDKEKLKNEALTYASRITPEARGDAERILQAAKGYQLQTVAEATGQTARFLSVLGEYGKAPDATRKRMYLETMERVLGGANVTIIDRGSAAVPFLSLGRTPGNKAAGN